MLLQLNILLVMLNILLMDFWIKIKIQLLKIKYIIINVTLCLKKHLNLTFFIGECIKKWQEFNVTYNIYG